MNHLCVDADCLGRVGRLHYAFLLVRSPLRYVPQQFQYKNRITDEVAANQEVGFFSIISVRFERKVYL